MYSICCVSALPVMNSSMSTQIYSVNFMEETSKKEGKLQTYRPSPWVVFDEILMLAMRPITLMRFSLLISPVECPPKFS